MVAGHTKPPRLGPSNINATGMSPAHAASLSMPPSNMTLLEMCLFELAFDIFLVLPWLQRWAPVEGHHQHATKCYAIGMAVFAGIQQALRTCVVLFRQTGKGG